MKLSNTLLELLVCPVSGDKLEYDKKHNVLISKKAGLMYPIIDGIPMVLESEAMKITKGKKE
ncbi:Trm112 family protein [Rickettsiaceae bacterium]|nr:Trm112 family protein [Rickettsiaceae bacterium]